MQRSLVEELTSLLCVVTNVTDDAEDDYDEPVADVDAVAIGNQFTILLLV